MTYGQTIPFLIGLSILALSYMSWPILGGGLIALAVVDLLTMLLQNRK